MVTKAELKEDPKILKLIKGPSHPTLETIGPLAKERGITSAWELWDFFDQIRALWHEAKDYSGEI